MSTFGRGIRYELERIDGSGVGGTQTILTVPSNSNYLIFINVLNAGGVSGLSTFIRNIQGYSSGTSLTTLTENIYSGSSADTTEFMDFGEGGNLASPALPYGKRILFPNHFLQHSGSTNTRYTVYYTKVYFGGQSNY